MRRQHSGQSSTFTIARSAAALSAVAGFAAVALAGPEGAQIVRGNVQINRDGGITTIHAGDRSIINYRSFDIAGNETVRFIQPTANSSVLNRITGAAPTQIEGTLTANGRVYLVNPAGVFFGRGAVIDASRFMAAAGRMTDQDFIRGIDRFTDLSGKVVNNGTIKAGTVLLAGAAVENNGQISGQQAVIAAGQDVFVRNAGSKNIFIKVSDRAPAMIESQKKRLTLGAGDATGIALGVSNAGAINATQYAHIESDTTTNNSGSITTNGGTAKVLGQEVIVSGTVDSSGANGGGTALVGGNWQGNGTERNAQFTTITSTGAVRADATTNGNGGTVVVWGDSHTQFEGSVTARGGLEGGNGGQMEVSGKQTLAFKPVEAAAGARDGKSANGSLLLDPKNITIVDGGTDSASGQTFGSNPSSDQSIDASALATVLNGGTNLTLQANNDINIGEDLTVNNASGNGGTLTLQAGRSINIASAIVTDNGGFQATANSTLGDSGNRDAGLATITLTGSINAGSGTVLFQQDSSAAVGAISLGGNITAGLLDLRLANNAVTQSTGSLVLTGLSVQDGNLGGTVTLNGTNNSIGQLTATLVGNLTVSTTGALAVNAVSVSGTTRLTAGSSVTQNNAIVTSNLIVKTLAADGAGGIALNNANNSVSTIDLRTRDIADASTSINSISYRDTNSLTIARLEGGSASVTSGGFMNQTGAITLAGAFTATTLNNSGSSITLVNSANSVSKFTGATYESDGATLANAAIGFRDADTNSNGLVLGAVQTLGSISVTSKGNVTQESGTGLLADSLTVDTRNNAGASIILANAQNTVNLVGLNAFADDGTTLANGLISYRDSNGVSLGNVRTLSDVTIVAGDAITTVGEIKAVTLNADTRKNGGASITLDTATNDVTRVVLRSLNGAGTVRDAGDLVYRDANSAQVSASTTGNATFVAGGAIGQNTGDTLTANVLTLKTLNDSGSAITLQNTTTNSITSLSAQSRNTADDAYASGNITFAQTGSFNAKSLATLGALDLSTGGTVTQSGAETGILATFLTLRNNGSYTFDRDDNLVNVVSGNVFQLTLDSIDSLRIQNDFGINGISGDIVTLRANGSITQTAPISVNQINASTYVDGGGDILLQTQNNLVGRALLRSYNLAGSSNQAGNLALKDTSGGLVLDGWQTEGRIEIAAVGAVSQLAALLADTLEVRVVSGGTGGIQLSSFENDANRIVLEVRNAADTLYSSQDVRYLDNNSYTVQRAGTAGEMILSAANAGTVDQDGSSEFIVAGGLYMGGAGSTFGLTNTSNLIDRIAATAGSVNVFSIGALSVGTVASNSGVNNSSYLRMVSNGAISQTQGITATTLIARTLSDAGADIVLNNALNNTGAIVMQARDATNSAFTNSRLIYRDVDGFSVQNLGTLGNATIQGETTVNQSGALQAITVGGLRTLGVASFTLDNTQNTIPLIAGTGSDYTLFTNGPLAIGTIGATNGLWVSGNVNFTSTGAMSQTQQLRGNTLVAKTLNDAGADIILVNAGNNFPGGTTLSARDAADANDVTATLQYGN
jgi:filamentous hemagglutinin family protein